MFRPSSSTTGPAAAFRPSRAARGKGLLGGLESRASAMPGPRPASTALWLLGQLGRSVAIFGSRPRRPSAGPPRRRSPRSRRGAAGPSPARRPSLQLAPSSSGSRRQRAMVTRVDAIQRPAVLSDDLPERSDPTETTSVDQPGGSATRDQLFAQTSPRRPTWNAPECPGRQHATPRVMSSARRSPTFHAFLGASNTSAIAADSGCAQPGPGAAGLHRRQQTAALAVVVADDEVPTRIVALVNRRRLPLPLATASIPAPASS